jgi:YD repeat-containing protein
MGYDPNGNETSIGSTQFGTWNYAYDADDRLTSAVEPQTADQGLTGFPDMGFTANLAPTTFSYTYYLNGALKVLQASSGASFSISHTYRQDGLPSLDSYSAANATISHVYTAAGRLATKTDPVGATTKSYNAAGQLMAYSSPTLSYSGVSYDLEDEPVQYSLATTSQGSQTSTFGYSETGQLNYDADNVLHEIPNLVSIEAYLDAIGVPAAFCLDGYAPTSATTCAGDEESPVIQPIIDTRNLTVVGYEASPQGVIASSQFDANGRLIAEASMTTFSQTSQLYPSAFTTHTYTYDAENHLTEDMATPSASQTQLDVTALYAWGPNGHPIGMEYQYYQGPSFTLSPWLYQTLHWSGNQLLFSNGGGGNATDYKLGMDGDVFPADTGYAGAVYYDRNLARQAIGLHSAAATWAPTMYCCEYAPGLSGPADLTSPQSQGPGPTYISPYGPELAYSRTDGITNGLDIIQGGRAVDQSTFEWVTPDAFEGDVQDPMSQAKYIWNGNNAFMYSDPSGYDTCGNSGSHDHKEDCGSAKNLQTIVTVKACARTCVSDAVNELQNKFSPDSANGVIGTLAFMIPGGEGAGAVEGAAARELSGSALTLSKTVAGHAASRPYVNSRFLVEEIMRAKAPVPDPGGLPGGLRWDVPGTFNSSSGTYQLVVDPATKQIVHFLFTSTP